MAQASLMRNAHLEGDAFFWQGGPTGVLLIHGFTATTAEVRPLARILAESGYSVAAPLLPGHMSRPEDANRYHRQDWLEAVEATYRRLSARCERIVVGGESLGGLLALQFAMKHPETAAILAYAPAIKLNVSRARQAALHIVAPFTPYVNKNDPEDDLLWQGYTVYPLRAGQELFRLQRDVRRQLPQIRQPLLIIQGRLDTAVNAETPDILARNVRSTRKEIHWLAHSSHCVLLDRELAQAGQITLDFLAAVLPGYSSVMVTAPSAQVDSQV
jgi:carboxylesterase